MTKQQQNKTPCKHFGKNYQTDSKMMWKYKESIVLCNLQLPKEFWQKQNKTNKQTKKNTATELT